MSARSLIEFVGRRAAGALVILVAVSAVTFSFIHLAPGGPEQTLAGRFATPERLAEIRAAYGLDDPLPAQYVRYIGDVVRLDLGDSLATRQPVLESIRAGLGVTAPLVLISFALILAIGTALGTYAAHRKGSAVDRAAVGLSVAAASAPAFATGILLVWGFGVELAWLPSSGDGDASHLVLPIATLTIGGVAAMLKMTRTRVGQVLEEDHVAFARARGLSRRYILSRAVLRNAGIQIVTQSGAILLALVAGAIVVEATFDLNGLGTLLVRAVDQRDIPLVQGISLLITLFIVVVNLVVDLLYFALDPRLRMRLARA